MLKVKHEDQLFVTVIRNNETVFNFAKRLESDTDTAWAQITDKGIN